MEDSLALRASIIRHTAEAFEPDIFLVDKEPLGLRGEVGETLSFLKAKGTPLVLGLRDVMDEPKLLAPEWRRKNVLSALRDLYDEIWVYGLLQMCNPLADINLPRSVHHKIVYSGYLRRTATEDQGKGKNGAPFKEPWLLVIAGGGGDGDALIDWVVSAYEHDGNAPYPALVVFGPFMPHERRIEFTRRTNKLARIKSITFDPGIESLMEKAYGIVAMGGYNTFCEILLFDKPVLIVPCTAPKLEQYIRASRAEELGLVKSPADTGHRDPRIMATALRHLPQQARPSKMVMPGLLNGLPNVNRLTERLLESHAGPWVAIAQRRG